MDPSSQAATTGTRSESSSPAPTSSGAPADARRHTRHRRPRHHRQPPDRAPARRRPPRQGRKPPPGPDRRGRSDPLRLVPPRNLRRNAPRRRSHVPPAADLRPRPGRGHAALPRTGPHSGRAPRRAAQLLGRPPRTPRRPATGTGRIGFVDADDIAAVAARALTDEDAPDEDLILTGPEALTYDEVAAIVTEVTGRPVTHRHIGYEQMRERLEAVAPPDFAALLAEMDLAIANGAEDRTTDTVERLTGRPPNGLREVVARELGRLPG